MARGGRVRGFMSRLVGIVIVAGIVAIIWFIGPGKVLNMANSGLAKVLDTATKGVEQLPEDPNVIADAIKEGGSADLPHIQSATYQALEKLKTNISLPDTMTGYDRESFPHWEQAKKIDAWNGIGNRKCTVRQAVLIRDGKNVEFDKKCTITAGTWTDPYGVEKNGAVTHVAETDSSRMDADHIVPLAEAWRTGAKNWDEERRKEFANDPDNLMISSAAANRSKGDQSAASYLPPLSDNPASRRCEYVEKYILIKDKYQLTVTGGEAEALQTALDECSTQ